MADSNLSGASREYWENAGIDPSQLKKDSPEYWQAFRERANHIVRRTQPNFNTENRSVLTSSKSGTTRAFFMFRSYVDQPLRMLHRSATKFRNGRISARTFLKQASAVYAGLAMYAATRAVVKAISYKDEEELYDLPYDIITGPIKLMPIIGYPIEQVIQKIMKAIIKGEAPKMRQPDLGPLPEQFMEDLLAHGDEATQYMNAKANGARETRRGPNRGRDKSDIWRDRFWRGITTDILRYRGIPADDIGRIMDAWVLGDEEK